MARAALYGRVSTEDQAADDKTSLSEQLRALRLYAERNGYEIVDEITEDVSGRKRHTEGLERIYELADAGAIDTVMVYKWNRLARTMARYERIMLQMKWSGVDVISLDGQSNETPSGRAMNRMMAVFSELQRDDLIQTMKDGVIGRARSGRVIPTRIVSNGFVYDRDNGAYRVDERRMEVVWRAFRMVAVEGKSLRAVAGAFEDEGIPTATRLAGQNVGSKWHPTVIRKIILNDVYRPHDNGELAAMVAKGHLAQQVFDGLDPEALYGVQWYNRTQSDADPDSGSVTLTARDPDEWVAVPVEDAGVPREWVDKARAYLSSNIKHTSKNRYPWELKGRVFCPCGTTMTGKTVKRHREGSYAHYYVCNKVNAGGCEESRYWRASDLELEVHKLVSKLTQDPQVFTETVRERIEAERERLQEPSNTAEAYAVRLGELERKKEGYWELAADGDMPRDVMRARVRDIDKQQGEIRQELDALAGENRPLEEIEDLENMSAYITFGPNGFVLTHFEDDAHGPYSYRNLLDKLKIRAVKHKDGRLELTGDGCQMLPTARVVGLEYAPGSL